MNKLVVVLILMSLLICSCKATSETEVKSINKNGVIIEEQIVYSADTGKKENILINELPQAVIVLTENEEKYLVYDAIHGKYFIDKTKVIIDAGKIKEILFINRFKDLILKFNEVDIIDKEIKIERDEKLLVYLLLEKGKILSEISPVPYSYINYIKENSNITQKYNIKEYFYSDGSNNYYDGHEYKIILNEHSEFAKQALIEWGHLLVGLKDQRIIGRHEGDPDIEEYKKYLSLYPEYKQEEEIKQIMQKLEEQPIGRYID